MRREPEDQRGGAGKISEEAFFAWAKQAKAKYPECDAEKISLDELKAWLKNS